MADGAAALDVDVRLQPMAVDARYRRRVIFECCKWDPQFGDESAIGREACVLSGQTAARLGALAETLARETLEIEAAVRARPDILRHLGIPGPLMRLLATPAPPAVRVMRFDFHPTTEGWALSEVNSDVPGGFAEASALPRIAAPLVPGAEPSGDAADALVHAFVARFGAPRACGFVHATAYADDRQVMQFLAGRFAAAGAVCRLLAPDHLRWENGAAVSIAEGQRGPLDGVIRFFPAEWLPDLPRRSDWRSYFSSSTPQCNPPQALLSQSKRIPLFWNALGLDVPAWRRALPETCDARAAPLESDSSWLLKPALGRVGEAIAWRGLVPETEWRRTVRDARRAHRHWVAQRRFESRPLSSGSGPKHLCLGVFTVDGKAAGFYGRLSRRPIIDSQAEDAPVLVATAGGST